MVRMAASLASDLFSLCAVNSQFVSLRCQFASCAGLIGHSRGSKSNRTLRFASVSIHQFLSCVST